MATPQPNQIDAISVQYQTMQDSTDGIKRAHDSLQHEHDQLYSFLQKLRGDWQGQGGESWDQAQSQWDGSFTWILAQLKTLHLTLVNSHNNYVSTDTALAKHWNA